MARPTVNDIARVAGVSLATVDRVLNERPGVRPDTVRRVNAAVDTLGYVRDLSAANLARQREYRLLFVLPDSPGLFLDAIRETLDAARRSARDDRTRIDVRHVAMHEPHALVRLLDAIDRDAIDGVALLAPETPPLRDAVDRLLQDGVAVVPFVSDLPNTARGHFVGIDNVAAGRTAGVLIGRFLPRQAGKVLVLVGSVQARDSIERRLGFDAVMAEQFPHLAVLASVEGHDDPDVITRVLGRTLSMQPFAMWAFTWSFLVTLAGTVMFLVVSHFPEH